MHRYATAPRATFEELFEHARSGVYKLDEATYPPACGGRSGEVSLSLGRSGAMIVHVEPGACGADEFRMKLLFETGTCVFSTPDELWRFWTGPLAASFGITTAEPGDQPELPAEEQDRETRLHDMLDAHDDVRLEMDSGTTMAAGQPFSRLTSAALAMELRRVIHGQDAALERVATTAVAQLRKRHPARPGSVLLLGSSGTGKTATVEALPAALERLGLGTTHVFRLDCGELTDSIQLTRVVGSPPGYSGHTSTTPLLEALEQPGCILLVDDVERAHPDLHDLLAGLLDSGYLRSPSGRSVDARHIVIAVTTGLESGELAGLLGPTPLADRWAVRRACAEHLERSASLPPELLGRIGAFAVFSELEDDDARRGIVESAIVALGREYGLEVEVVDPTALEVVEDIALDSGGGAGARALHHAARELLAERFAELSTDGPVRRVEIEAGPPLAVRAVRSADREGMASEAG